MKHSLLVAFVLLSLAALVLALSVNVTTQFIVVVLKPVFRVDEEYIGNVLAMFYVLKIIVLYLLSSVVDKVGFLTPLRLLLAASAMSLTINVLLFA